MVRRQVTGAAGCAKSRPTAHAPPTAHSQLTVPPRVNLGVPFAPSVCPLATSNTCKSWAQSGVNAGKTHYDPITTGGKADSTAYSCVERQNVKESCPRCSLVDSKFPELFLKKKIEIRCLVPVSKHDDSSQLPGVSSCFLTKAKAGVRISPREFFLLVPVAISGQAQLWLQATLMRVKYRVRG